MNRITDLNEMLEVLKDKYNKNGKRMEAYIYDIEKLNLFHGFFYGKVSGDKFLSIDGSKGGLCIGKGCSLVDRGTGYDLVDQDGDTYGYITF